ncbi:MAG: cytochrome c biogenesis protein CcsA [Planctomycetota bacterium]
MFRLPTPEMIAFVSVVVVYLAAAIVGILQLLAGGDKYKGFLLPLVLLAVTLEVVILIFRAIAIKVIPLTGLFESMIVLTIVFGLIYLFFSVAIQRVWFGSVMVWLILAMILTAGIVAEPASEPRVEAATPWAIAHGIAMVLGGASTAFATASAFLYLLGRHKLKRKKVMQVLGRVPNIERLERMSLLGLKACFVLMTFGLISGIGVAVANSATLEISVFDAKIVLITTAWVLLGTILTLRRIVTLKGKTTAYMTIAAFVLILFAIVGTTVFCGTTHDFTKNGIDTIEVRR